MPETTEDASRLDGKIEIEVRHRIEYATRHEIPVADPNVSVKAAITNAVGQGSTEPFDALERLDGVHDATKCRDHDVTITRW